MATERASLFRIGNGIDIHPFEKGRKLFLGGVEIPAAEGLKGHSDADVLIHALVDAVLGALGWGDIGQWFPDSNPAYRGQASIFFLETVWKKACAEGWRLGNCDTVILAQKPKISPHVPAIKRTLAAALACDESAIGIKATTTEHLGFVGREEGILATAVVLLVNETN